MADETTPAEQVATKKESVATTIKATAAGLSPMALVMALPEPYSTWALYACVVFACAGLAATQIPMPEHPNSKLLPFYKILNFLAANWKFAANTAMALRGKTSSGVTKDTSK
ncbi:MULTISPECIES: hypothetical protein [Acetobacter]|uniref:Uncharacterized protein n=1 Tax=Acetobacter thailandicus TaxID=1502842 RepID=A0ABT3QDF6_9PROT|nr:MULTISPECIES: hypothetical protein [Acetobacter]MBS0959763.1 hypothetical protein [Acetobacter thailandicus]MBS1003150.1 hypothetical protein [Acetobacter thailandicus]MCX2563332.1 hypothetical protein [Acetobacter thailandicus]NHN94086.1 hypothetical protein [Acetobacter thailandicus]